MHNMSVKSRTHYMNNEKETVHSNGDADPILILMKEHEEGLRYLKQLKEAAEQIKTNGFSFEAFENLAQAIRYIDIEIRRHNENEEKYLFPLMERHLNGSSEVMRSEHRELWRAFNSLRTCVKDVEDMKIYATTIRDLVRCSESIVELLTSHITKENDVLFPMAIRILTKEEYRQLAAEIAAADPKANRAIL